MHIIFIIAILSAIPGFARLHVNTKYLALNEKPVGFVDLWNSGDKTLYVQVEGARYDLDESNSLVFTTNPNPKVFGLLYTPQKLVIKPGLKKRLRVSVLNQSRGNEHQYYRLKYNVLEKPIDYTTLESGGMRTSVSIGLLYETIVDVGKAKYSFRTTEVYDKNSKTIKITNSGNAMMGVGPFYQCKSQSSCKVFNIYTSLIPGQSFQYRLRPSSDSNYLKFTVGNYFGQQKTTKSIKLN
jgi:hypothetical protein